MLMIALLLLSGFAMWRAIRPKDPVATPLASSVPELKLTYSLTRRAKGMPNPVLVYDTEPLKTGDSIWISVYSPQDGYLYVINESPGTAGNSPVFNVLFPSKTTNGGSAKLGAGQGVRLPESKDGY